jgi:hypothetical protein
MCGLPWLDDEFSAGQEILYLCGTLKMITILKKILLDAIRRQLIQLNIFTTILFPENAARTLTICNPHLLSLWYEGCSESNLHLFEATNIGVGESTHM